MYCQECGLRNDDKARTCVRCGFNFAKPKHKSFSILFEKPRLLYAAIALLMGSLFIGSYTYFRYEDLAMKKREQVNQEANKILHEIDLKHQQDILDYCLETANKNYWSYVKINGKKVSDREDVYEMPQFKWDHVEKTRKEAKELCFEQFPIK